MEINVLRPDIAVLNGSDNRLIDRDLNILENSILNRRKGNASTYLNIATDEANLKDSIVNYDNMDFKAVGNSVEMRIQMTDGLYAYALHRNAIMQLASKNDVNGRHVGNLIREGSNWSADILAYTLQQYAKHKQPKKRAMVRAVIGNENAEVRGVLSDSYHRYSSGEIYSNLLQAYKDKSLVLKTQYDGLSSYIELISNKMKSFYVDGSLVNMMFGLQIRNSSFGTAALDVRPFSMKVVCGNGMTSSSTMRSIHMAGRNNTSGFLSSETLKLESRLNKSRVLDAANFIFSDEQINTQIEAMTELGINKVGDKEIKQLTKLGVNQSELDDITKIILGGSEDDGLIGNNSAYDVVQAITRVSQDKPLVREKELQDVAGTFIDKVIRLKRNG